MLIEGAVVVKAASSSILLDIVAALDVVLLARSSKKNKISIPEFNWRNIGSYRKPNYLSFEHRPKSLNGANTKTYRMIYGEIDFEKNQTIVGVPGKPQ